VNPWRADYGPVSSDTHPPALAAVLFDFSHTLFRPEKGTDWVRAAGGMAGAALDEPEVERIASEIERLLVADEHTERQARRDLSADAHRAAVGGVLAAFESTVEGLGEALYERLIAADAWRPYEDAEPVLRALHEAGLRVGVVSNIGWDIRGSFRHHGLDAFVDSYTLSFELGIQKPDSRLFEHACNALGVAAEAALMVGDNPVADGGAVRAGIATYLLPGAVQPGRSTIWGADSASDRRGLDRVLALIR
jgi:HAD superfamily hydrolase (TIGR01549 family)